MKKLIRYWNQNRLKIIIMGLIIVFIIVLIQAINGILKNTRYEENENKEIIVDTGKPSESVITGEKLPEEITNTNVDTIKQFVDLCNKKDYQNAYNFLTEDCKNKLYNTLDIFIENYCNPIFSSERNYQLELWQYTSNTYTYRITYTENNILETGSISSENNSEDYITIVEENSNKLNLNGFIEKRNINKMQEQDGVQITVNDRYMYRDFEEYSVTIKNNTNNTILLSNGKNSNDICLVDTNKVEYDSILNEIPLINLELYPGIQKNITIKFYKIYNLYRQIDNISFKNIILDKESYDINENNAIKVNISIDI